jgi:hypothetical protein
MEPKAMRQTTVSHSGPVFFFMLLLISTISVHALPAPMQAPSVGATVAVRMMEAVDSDKDPAGKQYRAAVVKAVNAGNGVTIPEGAVATVMVASSGSARTAQLSSVVVNGQVVAVTSGAATVTAAQRAAGSAVNAMRSLGGTFGHHANVPAGVAAVTAVATGQRVMLPPGVTLNFVLSQPLASSAALAGAPSSPAGQPVIASAASASTPPSSAPLSATRGQHWWLCQYAEPKDRAKPVLGSFMYYAVFPAGNDDPSHGLVTHFNGYVQQNYKVADNYTTGNTGAGHCQRVFDDAAGRENSVNMMVKQWASGNIEPVHVNWTDTPAEDAAIDAKLASAKTSQPAAPPSAAGSKECAYHATCTQTPAPVRKPPDR